MNREAVAVAEDPLDGFERDRFTHCGVERLVFRTGTGPAVIIMAELPGITPAVAALGRRVAGIGCTAVLPDLFGEPGRDPAPGGRLDRRYLLSSTLSACVSREFIVWATGRTSPVVHWLRALAAHDHERCGGPGVGVVGMCFTGGFALAMAADDRVLAPVLSQPSLPVPLTRRRRRTIDISAEDLAAVKRRCGAGLEVIGLRFQSDRLVPPDRFRFLREQLGDAFRGVELRSTDANPGAVMPPHSVLTEHLIDRPGTPTRDALDQVLDLFRSRLLPDGDGGGAQDPVRR